MRPPIALLLGLALSALCMTQAAHAADPLFYTATYVEVVAPAAAGGSALLRQYRDASRGDPGTIRLDVLQRIDRPAHFAILATWKDRKAFEAHAAAVPARELRDKLQPVLASPNDERSHHGLSVGPGPAGGTGALYAVTHVDVIPPRKDDGVALLTRLAEDSRQDGGNVRFDVVQQTNRPNHFTVVEEWQDRLAFDAHAMAPHTRQFRDRLAPMSGALYDERLYTILGTAR
jgi:quinol monooxygenase YgiN